MTMSFPKTEWTDVAAEADLFEGAGIAVTPEGQDIALFKLADGVYAINNLCTHGNAKLCDGFVEGDHQDLAGQSGEWAGFLETLRLGGQQPIQGGLIYLAVFATINSHDHDDQNIVLNTVNQSDALLEQFDLVVALQVPMQCAARDVRVF